MEQYNSINDIDENFNEDTVNEKEVVEQWRDFYILSCPHCKIKVIVHTSDLNCRVFRCSPILSPHAVKQECESHINDNQGCCRAFVITKDHKWAIKCGYI